MRRSLSKDAAFFNVETIPRYTFLRYGIWRSHNPVRITKSSINGKSFTRFELFTD